MRKKASIIIFLTLVSIFSAFEKIKPELPEVWKKWLDEEVVYIITPLEREVFLSLKSGRERDAFKQAFWLQRDPTPGTPANEFMVEHYRRLKHAREYFGRGTVKLGWETDRGRIYIILGDPVDIQRFYETSANLAPTELWQYYSDTSLGLPPVFYVVFYQEMSTGDYKLYSPSFDGPQRLTRDYSQSLDRYEAYQKIKQVSAELAEASLSLIPGTGGDPSDQTSSLSSDLLINDIQRLPEKKVKSEWAEAFSRHKEIVTTDYSVDYVQCNHVLFVHQENNQNYLHAVIEPYRLSMSQYDDKVYASLKLNTKISSLAGETIHQEEKNVQLEMSPEDFKKIERRLTAIGDVIPLVQGNYQIDFLLRNTNSKEFCSLEESVLSPSSGAPSLSPILFLFSEADVSPKPETLAFLFHDRQLYPNTQRLYAKSDEVLTYFEVYNPSPEMQDWILHVDLSREDEVLARNEEPVGTQTFFLKKFPLENYPPGYYKIGVSVTDNSGTEVIKQSNEFSVSQLTFIPRPWSFRKVYPPLVHPYFSMIRAFQYLGLKEYDRAIQEIEACYNRTNPHKEMAEPLARAYFGKSDYAKVIDVLTPLKEIQEFEILELLGKSYYALGDCRNAIDYFKKALIVGGEVIDIINSIGFCYLRINDPGEALKAFERSLQLSPNQPDIKQRVDRLKGEGKK
jgi:GWxTD domain-containing protein